MVGWGKDIALPAMTKRNKVTETSSWHMKPGKKRMYNTFKDNFTKVIQHNSLFPVNDDIWFTVHILIFSYYIQ